MITLTENYFSVNMELIMLLTYIKQRLSHVAPLEKANTFMQAFRKFQLKKIKFILLINVFLDVTVLNA